ncbi:MAG: hypothetical protein ABS36_01705 [Acidobacteria bacterium SCN 69-37]|nr:MAG: hypothetical protein ABS36_01705 [Acidobacteria bacterium SCN 69-37]
MTRRIRIAVLAVLVASLASVAPAAAQTVDDIVARHLASRGGAEKWRAIQTQQVTGAIYTQDIELGMFMLTARPNLGHQELTLALPGQDPAMILNVFDGAKAWTINPMLSGPTTVELTGRDADMVRDQSEFESPLIDYRAKGYTVDLVGTETLGDRRVYRLKVTRPGRGVTHYLIDTETGVERRIESTGADGSPMVVDLLDHRPVDGVLVPFDIRMQQPGQPLLEVVVSTVEFNVPADASLFKRP